MKTLNEVERWCLGAAKQYPDPAIPVGHVFLRYVANVDDYRRDDDLVFSADGSDVTLLLCYGSPIRISVCEGGPEFDGDELASFGVQYIADGLWCLTPSLNIPGLIHAFVTLYDVPHLAPWQRSILLVAG